MEPSESVNRNIYGPMDPPYQVSLDHRALHIRRPEPVAHVNIIKNSIDEISWKHLCVELENNFHDSLAVKFSYAQNGCNFADDIFKCILMNEKFSIFNGLPLNFEPKGPINNIPTLVQIMAWWRSGNKPLSEPMMA